MPGDVYGAYRALKDASEDARYAMRRFAASEARQEMLDRYLTEVTAFVDL